MAPHLFPLLVGAAASVIVGRPAAWIGVLLPLGPLAAAGLGRLLRSAPPPGWRPATLFAVTSGLMLGGGWALVHIARLWPPLGVLFPVGLLLVLLGVVNTVAVFASRSIRAWRGQPLDYPWIPTAWAVGSPSTAQRNEGG